MAKIYRTSLNQVQRSLNHVNSITDDDIKQMLDVVFEEGDLLNENNEDENYEELNESMEDNITGNENLDIEKAIDLGPWVFIDSSELPAITRRFDDSENDEDWDPESID